MNNCSEENIQHVFIIGAKSIGQYGGYETFVDRLIMQHEDNTDIQYHVACKANGEGSMDENKLQNIIKTKVSDDGEVLEFFYRNAHVFKIKCPNIGPAVAIYYDNEAINYSIKYCIDNNIKHPIFYVLTCRIGLFINKIYKKIKSVNGKFYLNPDGHEWRRSKWPLPVRKYWKWSEKKMVSCADLIICDSENIEKYIKKEYAFCKPNTCYIAYGADVQNSTLSDEDEKFCNWLTKNNVKKQEYYLIVGRFVPENNYETMIREYMRSKSKRKLIIITNNNDKFMNKLQTITGFKNDQRISFVGTVYDKALLKKIRENAYGYIHGHEVGGTNPSLLEALGATNINLLLDVGFNREVGLDAAMYWSKEEGALSSLIDKVDKFDVNQINWYGARAKERITKGFSWKLIGDKYLQIWKR